MYSVSKHLEIKRLFFKTYQRRNRVKIPTLRKKTTKDWYKDMHVTLTTINTGCSVKCALIRI